MRKYGGVRVLRVYLVLRIERKVYVWYEVRRDIAY